MQNIMYGGTLQITQNTALQNLVEAESLHLEALKYIPRSFDVRDQLKIRFWQKIC